MFAPGIMIDQAAVSAELFADVDQGSVAAELFAEDSTPCPDQCSIAAEFFSDETIPEAPPIVCAPVTPNNFEVGD